MTAFATDIEPSLYNPEGAGTSDPNVEAIEEDGGVSRVFGYSMAGGRFGRVFGVFEALRCSISSGIRDGGVCGGQITTIPSSCRCYLLYLVLQVVVDAKVL